MTWKPIETAGEPSAENFILVCRNNPDDWDFGIVFWGWDAPSKCWTWLDCDTHHAIDFVPTHWNPLNGPSE